MTKLEKYQQGYKKNLKASKYTYEGKWKAEKANITCSQESKVF